MKSIFYALPVLFIACARPISVERLDMDCQVGKCYYRTQKKRSQGGFVLKFIAAQTCTLLDSIPINHFDWSEGESLRMSIAPSSIKGIVYNSQKNKSCLDLRDAIGYYCICCVETPASYRTIVKANLDTLLAKGVTCFYFNRTILLKEATILKKNYAYKPLFLKKNEYWYNNGDWSSFRDPYCPSGGSNAIAQLELKLKKLGYRMTLDNHLSSREKRLIRRFQKKNGLKVGELSIETLKKLEVMF